MLIYAKQPLSMSSVQSFTISFQIIRFYLLPLFSMSHILSKNIFNRLCVSCGNLASQRHHPTLRSSANNTLKPEDLYEPRFESDRKYPDIALLNVLLQAYDFQPIEKFQAYVHWAAKHFGIQVVDSYALSHTSELVKEFKAGSKIPVSQYVLKMYSRVVRIGPVPAIQIPLFIILLQAHAPVGTKIIVKKHSSRDERCRYISDPQLQDFKETLRNLDDPVVRKLLGWEA